MAHRVIYGGGAQTLRHVPVDRLGRATIVGSAMYEIVDATQGETSPDREVVASTAAVIDGASEALTAAAGRNASDPHALAVASNTGFSEGGRYVLSTADGGDREVITLRRVDSLALYTHRPIAGVYPTNSLVRGVEISGTFPSDVANDLDRAIRQGRDYYVVWTYTIGGQVIIVREPVPVERYSVASWVTEEEVLLGQWSLKGRLDPNEIHEAMRAAMLEVVAEIEAAGTDISQIRPTEMARQAVRYGTLAMLYEDKAAAIDGDRPRVYRARYDNMILKLTNGRSYGAKVIDRQDDVAQEQGDLLDKFVIG